MATPILVTSAAGRVGGVGRTITELLLKQGKAVRAMVRNEDERARALRDMGAEVVVGDPQPHIGKIYHLTGPQSEDMYFYAQEYSKALGRTIIFQDIPLQPWRDGLLERGLPVHLVNHLATMADLHRAGRYDRMSDDVLRLTGQGPLSVQEFVRKNAATFTALAKDR